MTILEEYLPPGLCSLEGLAEARGRARRRTIRLLLQAAWREGLLEHADRSTEGDLTVWNRDGFRLAAQVTIAGGGDRLTLESDVEGSLEDFLATLRGLAGLPQNQAWAELIAEMKQAEETQAASYALAPTRPEPENYLDFESWTPEGHNLHPGAKTRLDFSVADQLRYAPDFSSHIALPWIAVKKSLLQTSGEIPEVFEHDDLHWALPVHPWQRDNVLPTLYAKEWKAGEVRNLEREALDCRICTSLRTVVPIDPSFPVLKTSVGCLMTSTERSMSRYTVLQGPVYTEYLRRIFSRETYPGVTALAETGGFCWKESGEGARSRNLSLLFRQRPPAGSLSQAVPCSTLPQPTRDFKSTYFHRLFTQGPGPLANFARYMELLVPFHLKLYVDYGLALEAHLQNCVVEWSDQAGPSRLWVRDWGGLRADAIRIKERAPDLFARLSPHSVTLSDAESAEKKLIACLYCNHVTEVVAGVASGCELEERLLWRTVREISERALGQAQGTALAHKILRDRWPVKCLLKMRMGLGGPGDVYLSRPNPLTNLG